MKKWMIPLFLFLLGFTLTSCNNKEDLNSNLNDQETTTKQINDNTTTNEVVEMDDGTIVEYIYNPNGLVIETTIYYVDGSYEKNSYYENGSIHEKQMYGKDNSFESYTYNENGKILTQINKNGIKTSYFYDANEKKEKIITEEDNRSVIDLYDENEIKTNSTITYHNGVITEIKYYKNGMKYTVYTMNSDGTHLNETWSKDGLKCETLYSDGSKFVSTYYENGKIKTDTIYRTDNRIDYYIYDENGNTKYLRVTLADGTVHEYKYNENDVEQ